MKHPTIIASIILAATLLVSTFFICQSIRDKRIPVASSPSFPGSIAVSINGTVHTAVENVKDYRGVKPQPFIIQTNQ